MSGHSLTDAQCQEAIEAFARYGTTKDAARSLGMSRTTYQHRLAEAQRRADLKQQGVADAASADVRSSEDGLRDRVYELEAQLKTVRRDTLTDDYVKRKIIGLSAEVSDVKAPAWLVDMDRGHGLPGVPIALWSDWHFGEVVFPHQVNDVNEFNMEIARRRARTLVDKTIMLLRHHVVQPEYPGLVVALGGDMMSGDIHEELSESNELPVMPCLLDLFGVLQWSISKLADEFGQLFIPCVTGNHGRNTKKPRAKGRNFTNFDWLLYQFLARSFENDSRVTFYIPDGPDALFRVFSHRYLLTHGDQFRGGDGIIGAIGPITRGNSRKQARNSAINRSYDTMLLGHWHQYMPLHRTLVNGSLKGYDEYANGANFGYEPPIQALWLTHPQHGVTMHMPVYLEQHAGHGEGAEWVSWKDAA